jgi:sec-independent protein translocase protein TatC
MPFLDHLDELRRVLIDSLIAIGVGMGLSWAFSGQLLDLLITRTVPAGTPVIFLAPGEGFTARVKVALACGILVTLPFVFWRLWRFVVPGLLHEERTLVLPAVIFSTLLFYLGGAFGFFVLVPIVMKILLGFGTPHLAPTLAIGQLLGFLLQLTLACGIVFQLPLVTTLLTRAGLVSPEWLWGRWRYAVLIIFVVAAVVTPGDGPSQLVLGIPVTLLYFASVALSFMARRERRAGQGEGVPAPPDPEAPEPVTSPAAADAPTLLTEAAGAPPVVPPAPPGGEP